MWLFVNDQPCFGYIQLTTLNNKNTFGAPYLSILDKKFFVETGNIYNKRS